jgi:hypothetical protein
MGRVQAVSQTEKIRAQKRAWYARKVAADPAYKQRQTEGVKRRFKARYAADPVFRAKIQARNAAQRDRDPEKERRRCRDKGRRLKGRKYGLTPDQLRAQWHDQAGMCAICPAELPTFLSGHIDHDHKTKRVRGILCKHCNVGLGMFKENPLYLAAAIAYIK